MKNQKFIPWLYLSVFLLAIGLRFWLAWVNPEANDPHLEVSEIILNTGKLPQAPDCWECFQPKLYHAGLAALFRLLQVQDLPSQTRLANLVSALAGAATLAILWQTLAKRKEQALLSLLAFALTALNPKLIAIHAQATNDSLVIFFSSLALLAFARFLEEEKGGWFGLVILTVALAISTKTNGIVTFGVLLLLLLIRIWRSPAQRTRYEAFTLAYLVLIPVLLLANPFNQYISNLQKYGSPFLLNISRQPLPAWDTLTETNARPGILTLQDGFFTFKLPSLLEHPRIENPAQGSYPAHRTSLWTQLYGRAHSLHFDNWPPAWQISNQALFPLLRAIYLLALLPTLTLLWGIGRMLWRLTQPSPQNLQEGLWGLALIGYLAFVAFYALTYRDFSVMKAIFLFPALPALPLAFLAGMQSLPRRGQTLLFWLCLPLLILYLLEVLALLTRL